MHTKLERYIHFNMAIIGGFMGAYAIINHCDLFGSAQTTNLITIAMNLVGRKDSDWLIRIFGLFVYMAGLASTVVLPHRFPKWNLKIYSIVTDAVVLVLVGLLPINLNHFAALYPLFFAASIQWCSFKGADGYVSSNIFSTNNLRQFTTAFAEYFCTGSTDALHKGKFFGKMLFFYHIGVAFCFLTCQVMGTKASWIALFPVCTALALVYKESHVQVGISKPAAFS